MKTIELSVQNDSCVCLIGPSIFGASSDQNLLAHLGKFLREKFPDIYRNDEESYKGVDYFLLAELLQDARGGGINALIQSINEFLVADGNCGLSDSPLLKGAAGLPISYYVYFGFDDLLINALVDAGKTPITTYYYPIGEMKPVAERISPATPLVFNLFGRISEKPNDAIITETKLHEALPLLSGNSPCWPSPLISHMRKQQVASLFLGIRLHRWYNRFLLGVYGHSSRKDLDSAAFETSSFYEQALEHKEIILYMDNDINRVEFFQLKCERDKLIKLFHSLKQTPSKIVETATESDATSVFISYAHDDIERAKELKGLLVGAGIRTLCDANLAEKDDELAITGNFLKDIEELKGIDYFVPLVSKAVIDRSTHVPNEIDVAKTKQRRANSQFIVPVRDGDDIDPLKDLSLHHYNLKNPIEMQVIIRKLLERSQ